MISNTVGAAIPFDVSKSAISTCPASMQGADVNLYDATHPEWLYPVSKTTTGLDCGYTLNKLVNSHLNKNSDGSKAYLDDAPIPAGKYTIVAKNDITMTGGKQFVAVQPFVRSFKGNINSNNLLAYDSEAIPKITSILGLQQNPDGTFGGSGVSVEKNRAIQVTFNMAMARLSMLQSTSIKDNAGVSVPGIWKVSSDLLSATFYPLLDLDSGTVYTITVSNNVQNVYGKTIASTVTGSFTAINADTTPPNAIYIGASTGVKINKPLKIASSELLDINTMSITSTPSIGDKPAVIFIGFDGALQNSISKGYVYEIMPSSVLELYTDYTWKMGGAKDMAGNPLTEVTSNFKSESVATPPAIESVYPINNALGVPDNATLVVKFASLMNPESIGPASFTLSNGTGFLSGKVSYNPTTRIMEFKPSSNLPLDTLYSVTVKSLVGDLADNPMGADYVWKFSTVDITAPTVPNGLLANTISASRIDLNWNASSDSIGVTGYRIYRYGTAIANVSSGAVFSDTPLIANTTYCYQVTAYDATGNESAQSGLVCSATSSGGSGPPPPPPPPAVGAVVKEKKIILSSITMKKRWRS